MRSPGIFYLFTGSDLPNLILATGSGEPSRSGQIKLWNVADGTLLREIVEPHSDTVFGLEFSPDNSQVPSAV